MTIIDILKTLQEYYRKKLNETQVKIYMDTLDDIPVDLLDQSVKHLIKTGHPFMPKVAEIRTAARQIERTGKYMPDDPLKNIPGAAQTEADLDERYGTIEEHQAICAELTT
jgi:hypothetical protein